MKNTFKYCICIDYSAYIAQIKIHIMKHGANLLRLYAKQTRSSL